MYDEDKEGYPSYKRNTRSHERRKQQLKHGGAIYENVNTNSSERRRRAVGQVDVHDVDVRVTEGSDTVYENTYPAHAPRSAYVTSTHDSRYSRVSTVSTVRPEDEANIEAMFDNVLQLAQRDSPEPVRNLRQQMSSSSFSNPSPRHDSPDVNRNIHRISKQGGIQLIQPPPPRAVVQPLVQRQMPPPVPSPGGGGGSVKSGSSGGSSSFLSVEEVPAEVSSLSVEEVGSCLSLLHMDQHVPDFYRHQIDGHLLSDMRENVLQSEFRFTPFNASKLMRFVRGWRPKVN